MKGAAFSYSRGRLAYFRKSSGTERGREDFALTRNRDGSRTLRCLAMTDDSLFVRDAVYTVSAQGRPVDVLVRLQVRKRWVGTGYFRREQGRLRAVTDNADEGPKLETLEVPDRFHIMTHAVMLDGWTFFAYDEAKAGEQEITVYNTSTRWDGTDGPAGGLEPLKVEALGREDLRVPAGTFPARVYRVCSEVIDSPPAQLWVTGDDNLLLRYDWPGLDLEYRLVQLDLQASDR